MASSPWCLTVRGRRVSLRGVHAPARGSRGAILFPFERFLDPRVGRFEGRGKTAPSGVRRLTVCGDRRRGAVECQEDVGGQQVEQRPDEERPEKLDLEGRVRKDQGGPRQVEEQQVEGRGVRGQNGEEEDR